MLKASSLHPSDFLIWSCVTCLATYRIDWPPYRGKYDSLRRKMAFSLHPSTLNLTLSPSFPFYKPIGQDSSTILSLNMTLHPEVKMHSWFHKGSKTLIDPPWRNIVFKFPGFCPCSTFTLYILLNKTRVQRLH